MAGVSETTMKSISAIQKANSREMSQRILQGRSEYLALRLRQDPSIRKVYEDAADRVAEEIKTLERVYQERGKYGLTLAHRRALERSLRAEAERIAKGTAKIVKEGLGKTFDAASKPIYEDLQDILKTAGAELDFAKLQWSLAQVNTEAVEALWARYKGGMTISQRIWKQAEYATDAMKSIVLDGAARGRDAVRVARDLSQYVRQGSRTLAENYPNMMKRMGGRIPKDLCYEALRLARTEMTSAYMESTYSAGQVSPSYLGVRWNLSSSHPLRDVCNSYAETDLYGMGAGVYPKGQEPSVPHSNCLCYPTPVSEDREQFVDRLRSWIKNPASQPDIDGWYQGYYQKKAA